MPYKEKLKNPVVKQYQKPKYKILNWSDYNKSLKKRGQLSLYFPKGDLVELFINQETYKKGISGRQEYYSQAYIELIYMFYRLLGWGLRQITGYFEDLWQSKGLVIKVPSFGHLSDLFSRIPIKIKHFCDKVTKRLKNGEKVSLIMDSSGMSFDKASAWYEEKYGKKRINRPWRKLHITIDPDMEMYASELTECDVDDREMIDALMTLNDEQIESVIGDGGYYSTAKSEELSNRGITPVIPLPPNAVEHNKPDTQWHDKIVRYLKDKGSVYAFHKKYGYGVRSKIEAQFSRIKRCIGSKLQTQKLTSQKNEVLIIANILNLWNSFGLPVSVKIG